MRESVTYRELVAESEARGEVRGREQERRRVARQMLTMGMTPEQVTNVLGLSPEQVTQVRAEMSE